MAINKESFGVLPDGKEIEKYTLTNENGASVEIITLGGAIRALCVPDCDGDLDDVVCGYDTPEEYLRGDQCQGALIGRFANRIKEGKFTLNGKEYQITVNDGKNSLHGGVDGFGRRVWDVADYGDDDKGAFVTLTIHSPDGDQGFPGNLDLNVTYTLDRFENNLHISYVALSDADTVVNFTNHAYFNLAGYASCDVKDHEIWMASSYITETDGDLIPTGKLLPVKRTEFDLRRPTKLTGMFDDNFVLRKSGKSFSKPRFVCEVSEPTTGRRIRVYTDMPGIQVYAGVMMDGGIPFKGGRPSFKHCAFCLETQRWPDSPNHENFSDCVLRAGEAFTSETVYEFGAGKRKVEKEKKSGKTK